MQDRAHMQHTGTKISNDTLQMSYIYIYIYMLPIYCCIYAASRHVGVEIETVHPGILQGPELFLTELGSRHMLHQCQKRNVIIFG
jgi:hypothetical protein